MSTSVKHQDAQVLREPVAELMGQWINYWGYEPRALVYFDTTTGCAVSNMDANVETVKWSDNRLIVAISFNSPCTTNLTRFIIRLIEKNKNFEGVADIGLLKDSVSANQTYTLYYSETISKPTTARIQYS